MTHWIKYRFMQAGEEQETCDLVIRVFNEFVAHQYSEQDIQKFLKYVELIVYPNVAKRVTSFWWLQPKIKLWG